ncbi:unnamed protein product [Leptosia nina]|uniref:Protein kinase C-binding protein 1 n=1 Tax=Leptosia nina TaxID=320188 RepID=A0AAV1JGL3_9NEOP
MGDNSDINRDTDVSSTTADVPEVTEITEPGGGHIEMIITVEKVEENGETSLLQSSLKNEELNEDVASLVASSIKEKETKSTVSSPTKIGTVQKVASPLKEGNSSAPAIISPSSTSPVQEINSSNIIASPSTTTPTKDLNIAKSTTPTKTEQGNTQIPKTSPVKELNHVVDSSCKIQSPTKEMVTNKENSSQTTSENEAEKKKEESIASSSIVDLPETSTSLEMPKETVNTAQVAGKEDCDKADDSILHTSPDVSEKEHNKSISRELKSLINSAKESKLISECTQLTSKIRKSRTPLELNTSTEADKITARRNSNISSKSNCSGKSEKATKRSMRSQNPEFVNKVKQFLNSVTGNNRDSDDEHDSIQKKEEASPSPKKKKVVDSIPLESKGDKRLRVDPYCWHCHWAIEMGTTEKSRPPMNCTVCPRVYHYKCLSSTERNKIDLQRSWVCPECLGILQAESSETRSVSMKKISLGLLCELLQHALTRMMEVNGVEPFMQPVDRSAFPDYDKCVVHPMDLSLMKKNIENGLYGSPEAFLADTQWILHNSIIFNNLQSKLTQAARTLVRLCRTEMGEIEACPECYAAAHARKLTWFTDVCSTPHILLWAKLKGFPYWPAKGMSVNASGVVDVRFFGAHDRAWVPAKDCYLYSENDPNNFRSKKQILDSMQEAEQHIRNISRKYGKFVYPPFKTPFEPSKITEQLKLMIPSFEGELRFQNKEKLTSSSRKINEKRRSNSKSSKSSIVEGEASETEDIRVTPIKTPEADYTIRPDDENEAEKPMDIDEDKNKERKSTRKRRRSQLEEAVITIIENSTKVKRRRINKEPSTPNLKKESEETAKQKNDEQNKSVNEINTQKDRTVEDVDKEDKDKELPNSTTAKEEETVAQPSSAPKNETKLTNKSKFIKVKFGKAMPKSLKILNIQKLNSSCKVTSRDKHRNPKKKANAISNVIKNKSLLSVNNKDSLLKKPSNEDESKSNQKPAAKDKNAKGKTKSPDVELVITKSTPKSTEKTKTSRERLQFDDDTSLAVISRRGSNMADMPVISNVRSLLDNESDSNFIEVNVDADSNASIFTPTSTESVRNMKEAVNKLRKLRQSDPPAVGRVGVRAFARMKSPEATLTRTENPEVEVKSEPPDFGDSDRQAEKLQMMSSFRLQPVVPPGNPSTNALRDVRINKLVVTPIVRKTVQKPESRVKAKKTFPQAKKSEERSQLNSENLMVYIPIQPATGTSPMRPQRPGNANGAANTPARSETSVAAAATSTLNTVMTVLTPTMVSSSISLVNNARTTNVISNTNPSIALSTQALNAIPSVGPVPTSVHTVPFLTPVNGQWTFSLQPIMSVGGVDTSSNNSMTNGVGERGSGPLVAVPTPVSSSAVLTQINTAQARKDEGNTQLPRLQHKPLINPFDPAAPQGTLPPPSTVGPLTAKINQNSVKLADFFRTLLEDTLDKVNDPLAHMTSLKLHLEQLQWKHNQEMEELKHNHELTLVEMRASFERDKNRAVNEVRRASQIDLEAAVKATKAKQWCANCLQEAQFYCCWNTSYCDYPCQRAHWTQHSGVCTQPKAQGNGGDKNSKEIHTTLQPAPGRPKSTTVSTLSTGNKNVAPTRVYTSEQLHQKTSLISTRISVVDDSCGNQSLKCVGTYKQSTTPVAPIVLNKKLLNNEEAKKVTTSVGYFRVGNGTTVSTTKRPTTIQCVNTS